jgi:hypothetical protein
MNVSEYDALPILYALWREAEADGRSLDLSRATLEEALFGLVYGADMEMMLQVNGPAVRVIFG